MRSEICQSILAEVMLMCVKKVKLIFQCVAANSENILLEIYEITSLKCMNLIFLICVLCYFGVICIEIFAKIQINLFVSLLK